MDNFLEVLSTLQQLASANVENLLLLALVAEADTLEPRLSLEIVCDL